MAVEFDDVKELILSQILWSAPDTDSYGGGTRDEVFVRKVALFCKSLEAALANHWSPPDFSVNYTVHGKSRFSFRVVITVSLRGTDFDIISLDGCVGSSYSGLVLGERVTDYTNRSLTNDLVTRSVTYLITNPNGRR